MYIKIEPFGYMVYGETIGSAWLSLVETTLKNGVPADDEGRKRMCLQNIRVKSSSQVYPDTLLEKYGKKENINKVIGLTFDDEVMCDFDVKPSFTAGSKSYHARIKDWGMVEFVVRRLTEIPESKKAIMAFVRKEDYERTLDRPRDDYLPCITSIQFRLIPMDDRGYHLNTVFNARSIDAYQKAGGNFAAIALLSHLVAERLQKSLKKQVWTGSLDGMITDAHIYEETVEDAKKIIQFYKKYERNNES